MVVHFSSLAAAAWVVRQWMRSCALWSQESNVNMILYICTVFKILAMYFAMPRERSSLLAERHDRFATQEFVVGKYGRVVPTGSSIPGCRWWRCERRKSVPVTSSLVMARSNMCLRLRGYVSSSSNDSSAPKCLFGNTRGKENASRMPRQTCRLGQIYLCLRHQSAVCRRTQFSRYRPTPSSNVSPGAWNRRLG
jgi:hypothetical protein